MRFAIVIFILLLGRTSWCQTRVTLNEAIRLGLLNNFGLQISEEQVRLAGVNSKLAKQALLPRVDLKLRQNNLFEIDNSPTSFVEGNYTQNSAKATVDAGWVLFDGYNGKIESSRLKELENKSNGAAQLVIENTTQAIVLAYYKAILEEQKLEVLAEVTSLSKDRYEQGELLKSNGSKSVFDVLSLEKAWIQDSIQFIERSLNLKLAYDDLKYLVGLRKDEELILEDRFSPIRKDYNLAVLYDNLVSDNRDMQMQLINIRLQELSRKKLGSSRYPTIRLNASLSQDFNVSKFKGEESLQGSAFDFYGGFTVDYNLYGGGATKSLMKKAKIQEQVALLELAELEYRLKDELKDAFETYQNTVIVITKQEQLLLNLIQSLDLAKERLDGGYSTPLEYRSTQLDYLNANLDLLESLFKLKSAEIIMTRLTGGITKSQF